MSDTITIGGSEAAAALGVSEYETKRDLALRKLNLMPPIQDRPVLRRGRKLEPIIAEEFEERTGIQLEPSPGRMIHPDFPWVSGTFDRLAEGGKVVVEFKALGMATFSKLKRHGISPQYQLQLQQYMMFPGIERGIFAALNAERWEMVIIEQSPDRELQDMMVNAEKAFVDALYRGEIPEDTPSEVIDLPATKGDVITLETPEWIYAVSELREAIEIRKEAEALEEQAKAAIQAIMAPLGAGVAEGSGARVYWQEQKGRESWDMKRVRQEHPEVPWEKYRKIGANFKTFRPFFLKENYHE